MIEHIYTIGGYSHTEESYFGTLASASIDVLVDIRHRRGMRGSKYAFLNSLALQKRLVEHGIAYLHLKELAPTQEIRSHQKNADARFGALKRDRLTLNAGFSSKYISEILQPISAAEIVKVINGFKRPCFFCVEGPAAACHRSIASEWLATKLGVDVVDLMPMRR